MWPLTVNTPVLLFKLKPNELGLTSLPFWYKTNEILLNSLEVGDTSLVPSVYLSEFLKLGVVYPLAQVFSLFKFGIVGLYFKYFCSIIRILNGADLGVSPTFLTFKAIDKPLTLIAFLATVVICPVEVLKLNPSVVGFGVNFCPFL